MIGREPDWRCVGLATEAGRPETRETFKIAIAFDQAEPALQQRLEGGDTIKADEASLPGARPRLGVDGMAQQFAGPETDGDVEQMFEIEQDAGPLQPPGRISADAFDDRGAPKADKEGLKHMAEAMIVPQERSYPRKQPEDDLGQIHDLSIGEEGGGGENSRWIPGCFFVRALESLGKFFAEAVWIRLGSSGFAQISKAAIGDPKCSDQDAIHAGLTLCRYMSR